MKIFQYLLALAGIACLNFGCNYLDVVPDDTPTIDDAFKNRTVAERSLFTCYSYLPDPTNPFDYPAYFTSHDEFEIGTSQWVTPTAAYTIASGNQNANSPAQNYWSTMYKAIRFCNIFLDNIYMPRDMQEWERKMWTAEVKFLKAYYHYWLLALYGPIPVIRQNADLSTPPEDILIYREPVDECVDYIVELIDEAVPDLPLAVSNPTDEAGRITQPIALGIKAKVLALAASPLFNGNPDYAEWRDNRGKQLISSTYSAAKWERAAIAIKNAIDTCLLAGHELYKFDRTKGGQGTYAMNDERINTMTIRKAVTERWNLGIIWSSTESFANGKGVSGYPAYGNFQRALTPALYSQDNASDINKLYASPEMAELFYTKNGVPIDEDTSWPYQSRYTVKVATEDMGQSSYIATNEATVLLHFNREPRFYGSLGFDRGYFELASETQDGGATFKNYLKLRRGEPGSSLTGYAVKKLVAFETSASQGKTGQIYSGYNYRFPLLRLADLYLLYSEALNEVKAQPDAEVYYWIDEVRKVNGLNGVVESWSNHSAYPNRPTNKETMREIIQQERMIELAFEGQRFWDVRRWKLAESLWAKPTYGWNADGSKPDEYYTHQQVFGGRKVTFKDYLWPISLNDLIENRNLTQSYGW